MADSNEEKENPGGEEQARSRLAELEELAAEREQEVSRAKSRIGELEQLIARREEEVATLQQSSLESEQKLAEAGSALSRAVASYRARVIEANPEMPDDLIAGETIEAIDSSLGGAPGAGGGNQDAPDSGGGAAASPP